jgi:hypothetical protein
MGIEIGSEKKVVGSGAGKLGAFTKELGTGLEVNSTEVAEFGNMVVKVNVVTEAGGRHWY